MVHSSLGSSRLNNLLLKKYAIVRIHRPLSEVSRSLSEVTSLSFCRPNLPIGCQRP